MSKPAEPTVNSSSFIRAWRIHRDLSVIQLSELTGYHRTYISRVETGRRRWDQPFLEKVAQALQCRIVDLISKQPDKDDPLDDLTPAEREGLSAFIAAIRRAAAEK